MTPAARMNRREDARSARCSGVEDDAPPRYSDPLLDRMARAHAALGLDAEALLLSLDAHLGTIRGHAERGDVLAVRKSLGMAVESWWTTEAVR